MRTHYIQPQSSDEYKEIDNLLKEEENGEKDALKIAKLKQAKLMSMMFNGDFNIRGGYKHPW